MKPKANVPAFSLVEVVMALGIISFALIAVIGLVTVGLQANRESSGQIQAANTVSLLLATARALPTNPPSGFGIPNLSQATVANVVQIGVDGATNSGNPSYSLYYSIGTNTITGPKLANVYLCLWWPVNSLMPTNNPDAYYEVAAQVALP